MSATRKDPEMARRGRMRAAALHAYRSPDELAEYRRRGVEGLLIRFEREVDPDGRLDPGVRRQKAIHARRLHMLRIGELSRDARKRTNRYSSGIARGVALVLETSPADGPHAAEAVSRNR